PGIRDVRTDRRRGRGRDRACHPRHFLPPPRVDRGRRRQSDARLLHPVILIVFLPLLAAIVAGLGGRMIGKTAAKVITNGALMIGAALSWLIFIEFLTGAAEPQVVHVLKFIESGALDVDWALRVDTLTAVMLVVVTSVSSLVHLYSWGYMEEDSSQ